MVKVQIWGTRGSFPNPSDECREFGGNTTCYSIDNGKCLIVLDAGTGLVPMGRKLSKEKLRQPLHIFLSHVHLDHIHGLFFFPPFFDRDMEIHIYGESRGGRSIQEQVNEIIRPPFWPLKLEDCGAAVHWHQIEPGRTYQPEKDISIKAIRASHPDEGDLYFVEVSGKTLLYGLDSELDEQVLKGVSEAVGKAGCDLLICDGFYTPEEYKRYQGRGHGSWLDGIRLAKACNAKRLLCSHHNYDRTDCQLLKMEQAAQKVMEHVEFAREGREIWL